MVSNRKDGQYHLFVAEDGFTMCDYSLHHVVSRPARVGDKLVSTGFSRSGTRGFAAIGEPNVAVCLLPGTEVAFEAEAQYEHSLDRLMPGLRFGFVGESLARFRQVNMEKAACASRRARVCRWPDRVGHPAAPGAARNRATAASPSMRCNWNEGAGERASPCLMALLLAPAARQVARNRGLAGTTPVA
jgi:hypothetical protein